MSKRPIPRHRNTYRHFSTVSLRWADNDAYGHVNNVVYYAWFDTAVNEMLVERGLLDIAAGDPIGLVVETGCRYFDALSYPGAVEVGLRIANIGTSSVAYELGIFRPGEEAPVAEGHFIHVYVGREDRRPTPLPDSWRVSLEELA
ncbi:MAG: acyl-CoA thioesterase [Erythrobacter sp.]|nr:acyl-CoA thioesterase [Erythrobacter sp.]NNC48694.1 acyl-CoA thioesterase [Sphingomonas sp.]RZV46774.1 MAG: acyl-CoA thioesterase [Sphingomonadaceae bacterium]